MRLAIIVLLTCSWPLSCMCQTLTPDEVSTYISGSLAERAFILKSAENGLVPKLNKMAEDPSNSTDGFLWVNKVVAGWYASLSADAEILHVPQLSSLYKEKAELLSMRVRGELNNKQTETQERIIEAKKTLFFESILASGGIHQTMPVSQMKAIADMISRRTHGLAVMRATK